MMPFAKPKMIWPLLLALAPHLVEGGGCGLGEDGSGAESAGGGARLDGLGVPRPPVHRELEVRPHLVQERLLANIF